MKLAKERDSLVNMLKQTISLMCKSSLTFDAELSVEGLLGITLDKKEIFLVNINESVSSAAAGKSDKDSESETVEASNSSAKKRKRKRRRKSSGSASEEDESNTTTASDHGESHSNTAHPVWVRPASETSSVGSQQFAVSSSQFSDSFSSPQQSQNSGSAVFPEPVQIKKEFPESQLEDLIIVKEEFPTNFTRRGSAPGALHEYPGSKVESTSGDANYYAHYQPGFHLPADIQLEQVEPSPVHLFSTSLQENPTSPQQHQADTSINNTSSRWMQNIVGMALTLTPEEESKELPLETCLQILQNAKQEMDTHNISRGLFSRVVLGRTCGILNQLFRSDGMGHWRHLNYIDHFLKLSPEERHRYYTIGKREQAKSDEVFDMRPSRTRTYITSDAKKVMDSVFKVRPYIFQEEAEKLSKELGLDKRTIFVYFQNQRASLKRAQKKSSE